MTYIIAYFGIDSCVERYYNRGEEMYIFHENLTRVDNKKVCFMEQKIQFVSSLPEYDLQTGVPY